MQEALSCNNCSVDYIVIETSRHLINKCVLNGEVYPSQRLTLNLPQKPIHRLNQMLNNSFFFFLGTQQPSNKTLLRSH